VQLELLRHVDDHVETAAKLVEVAQVSGTAPSLARSLALPCLALPCLALPCLALPCLALPCLALPCLALPCLALPCLFLSLLAPSQTAIACSRCSHH
jgi:hypothetical protein